MPELLPPQQVPVTQVPVDMMIRLTPEGTVQLAGVPDNCVVALGMLSVADYLIKKGMLEGKVDAQRQPRVVAAPAGALGVLGR